VCRLLEICPSAAHCCARQLSTALQLPQDFCASHEYLLLAATLPVNSAALSQIISEAKALHFNELIPILLCNGHAESVAQLEERERQEAVESSLAQLEHLTHSGINGEFLFPCLLLTNRHIVTYILVSL